MAVVITISASYGSGGSIVAPQLAKQLGARLLDRAIPAEIAQQIAVPLNDAVRHDETLESAMGRFLLRLAPTTVAFGGPPLPPEAWDERTYARATENVIRDHARQGDVVVLGRAGAIVLRDHPGAFHVRLDGRPAARVERAIATENISRSEAQRRLTRTDQAREDYVRHFYNCDPREARHYHLMLDATAYRLDDLPEIIRSTHRAWQRAQSKPLVRQSPDASTD